MSDPLSQVPVRRAGLADLDALAALSNRYNHLDGHLVDEARARAAFAGLLADDQWGQVLVVEDGDAAADAGAGSGTVVGYAVVTFGYSIEAGGIEALLDEIYLDVREQGLGSVLLGHVLELARHRGATRIFLETEADNHRARAFYRRHHFDQDDSIWLSRWL